MKVLFVLEHYYPYIGGAEKLFKSIAEGLQKNNFEVEVVTTRFRNKLPTKEKKNGIIINRLNLKNRFLFTFFGFTGVLKHARKADIIITTSYNAAIPAYIAAFLLRKKSVIIFHEVWGSLWFGLPHLSRIQKFSFFLFEQIILRLRFTRFVAVSEFTKNRLIKHGVSEKKVSRIYNGLDYSDFCVDRDFEKDSNIFTYTFFGRLGVSKGIELMIGAAELMSKYHPQSRFKLIIPTYPRPLFKTIRKMIREKKLTDHIEMKHNLPKSKLIDELCSSNCVVIPSYSEGFCFTAAEAVSLGVPLIASKNGALPEVVSGKHLFIEDFSAEGIFMQLESALNNLWNETPIRKFEIEDSVTEYVTMIEKMAGSKVL